MKRLEGKCALITGAARGIGLAFARAYVREGAQVAIADINAEGAAATAAEPPASNCRRSSDGGSESNMRSLRE